MKAPKSSWTNSLESPLTKGDTGEGEAKSIFHSFRVGEG
jgi:hypothetical protein